MPAWFSRIFSRSSSPVSEAKAAAVRAFEQAQRSRAQLTLESPQGLVACAQVRRVRPDHFIISQPVMNGMIYPLGDGDVLKFSFVEQSTNMSGQTTCQGRMKTNGSRGPTYIYRLAMPAMLHFEDRRAQPRNPVSPAVAPLITVTGGWLRQPLPGALADISVGGLRIHTAGDVSTITIGQELTVAFAMPDPAGLIEEVVEVHRVEPDAGSGLSAICVSFRRRVPRLEALLRMTTERVPMPLEQSQRKVA